MAISTPAVSYASYDLALSFYNSPSPTITVGDRVNYGLQVENLGNSKARRIRLTVTLAPNQTPAPGLDSRCLIDGNNQIVCNLGGMRGGKSKQIDLAFDIQDEAVYQLNANVSARNSDSNNSNNQVQHSFEAESESFVIYSWSEANNVLISNTTNYTNGSSGIGRSYGSLYPADQNGQGVGVIDGIISTYSLDANLQTIDITRGIPGQVMASGAQAIDAVSYRTIEISPTPDVIDKITVVCLFDENNQVYMHPYTDLFPLQTTTQVSLGVSTASAFSVTGFSPKLAVFYPGGIVDIDNVQHFYTATRDSLKVYDQGNALIYHAVRAWNDEYIDVSPANFDINTGTGIIASFSFSP